jgi:flagellar basal body P-ring protein FlgI
MSYGSHGAVYTLVQGNSRVQSFSLARRDRNKEKGDEEQSGRNAESAIGEANCPA